MRKLFFLFLFFSFFENAIAQDSDSVVARIVLIGDGGKLNFGRQPVVDAARNLVPMDKKTTVLYLGDNDYEGVPHSFLPEYVRSKAVIDSQINIAKGTPANVIFIPGNHEWTAGGNNHLDNLLREQRYVDQLGNKNVHYIPKDGCPGPVVYNISKDVILVLYDSEWFMEKGNKPGIESDCGFKTEQEFFDELDNILGDNREKLVLLAAHHTMKSYGIHGGYFTLKQYFFPFTDLNPNLYIPLPVIGVIYPIARAVFGTPEDLHYPPYANLINKIEKVVKPYPNVVFLAGHEHNLQLIKDSSYYYIVSGSGSKKTRVSKNKKHVLYESATLGFSTLTITKNKNLDIDFYTVNEDTVKHTYSNNLLNFAYLKKPHDSTVIPETHPVFHFKDSVTVPINKYYAQVSGFHKFFSGKNYRKEWATPVHLKVFRIDRTNGGYTIDKIGGGHQTKSLKLKDKNGRKWNLRTVDKDPAGALPEAFKGTIAQKIVQDMISAQSPYGPLVVPVLANAVDVVHNYPVYYFVPDDPGLGKYRKIFANKVCLLEPDNPLSDETKTKSDFQVINKMNEDSKDHVDQQAVLRARLFDMVIGDWDRHFGQWDFGKTDTGVGKLYFPIPKDRDQAFFNSDGLLAKAVSLSAIPYLQGFKKNYPNINWFNWEERDFDRFFMNNLDEPTWKNTISDFQKNLSDSVIDTALKRLPPEIYPLTAKKIRKKLKGRRDLLSTKGIKYYKFLSREVNVVSSNKDEYFRVMKAPEKGIELKVFKRKDENDSSTMMYDRIFDPNVTKYVNMYGLNGNDFFHVDSNVNSRIKLRMIGGQGIDTFDISGHIKNKVYDYAPEGNFLKGNNYTKNEMTASPNVNDYSLMSFQYNSYRIPMLNLGYNEVEGLLVGLGYSLKTFEFRKSPYATYQKLSSLFSITQKAYQVKYRGEFNQLFHNNDLVFDGQFFNPVLNYFFGYGNNSPYDKSKTRQFYYVRYKYVDLQALLRKKYFNNLLQFYIGPEYYHYWNRYPDNSDKVLAHPSSIGLDSSSIYNIKSYLGGKFSIVLNNLNSELLPTRGVIWNTQFSSLAGLNKNTHPITKLSSEMEVYASLRDPAKLVAVLKFGAGHIFSKNYEYFQAFNLGANNYLRGFNKNRFSGRSMAYQTTEFRVKLFESKSYFLPGAVGLIAFNEVGRVWVRNEISHKWHDDYGGGLYYSPYNFALVSAVIAHSPEDNLFNISIGTKFNINF
ncbi:MAG: BamA/TamA family outer membrane protein [Ginsengibacter sp.]